MMSSLIFIVVATIGQAVAIQMAYTNVKFIKKDQIATQRTQAVTKEIIEEFGTKMNKDEFADRILWKKVKIVYDAVYFNGNSFST